MWILLQIFLGIIAVTVLFLAANVAERQEAQRGLQAGRDALEQRVAERTAELLEANTALTTEIVEHQQAKGLLETQARVLRHMVEAVILEDECGGISYANAATETMFGYAADELLGRPLVGLLDETSPDKQRIAREISTQLDTGKTWYGELTNRKRDGTSFTTVARISPLEQRTKQVGWGISLREHAISEFPDSRLSAHHLRKTSLSIRFPYQDQSFFKGLQTYVLKTASCWHHRVLTICNQTSQRKVICRSTQRIIYASDAVRSVLALDLDHFSQPRHLIPRTSLRIFSLPNKSNMLKSHSIWTKRRIVL